MRGKEGHQRQAGGLGPGNWKNGISIYYDEKSRSEEAGMGLAEAQR